MFSSAYQHGRLGVSLFNPNGKDPLRLLKLQACDRHYDRGVKGYILCVECNGSFASMGSLGIIQPFLCFQMYPITQKHMSFEVIILDQHGNRRRFHFSTKFRANVAVPEGSSHSAKKIPDILHCQLPLVLSSGSWSTIVLDLPNLTKNCFRGAIYGTLEEFTIQPHCRLRKIFTLPCREGVTSGVTKMIIPVDFDFPLGVANEQIFVDSAQYIDKGYSVTLEVAATSLAQKSKAISKPTIVKDGNERRVRSNGGTKMPSPSLLTNRKDNQQSPLQTGISYLEPLNVEGDFSHDDVPKSENSIQKPYSYETTSPHPLIVQALESTSFPNNITPISIGGSRPIYEDLAQHNSDDDNNQRMRDVLIVESISSLQGHVNFLIMSIQHEKKFLQT